MPGAMPFLHRWLGQPAVLDAWRARWFRAPINDVYCGMRGFTKELYERLDQRCTGMEFATEMIIKSSLHRRAIAEVPITLHPDGRKSHAPHLRTFRDGWRTLRFFLMYSPRWLFLIPGLAADRCWAWSATRSRCPALHVFGASRSTRTRCCSPALAIAVGYQSILFAMFTKMFAISEGLMPRDPRMQRLGRFAHARTGPARRGAAMLAGVRAARARGQLVARDRFRRPRLREHDAPRRTRGWPTRSGSRHRLLRFFVGVMKMRHI